MNTLEIEKYLRNEMTEDERVFFESRVNTDNELKKELEEHALIYASFDKIRADEMMSKFSSISVDLPETEAKIIDLEPGISVKNNKFYYVKWAASFILIAVVGWLILNRGTGAGATDIYQEYYASYPNVVAPVSRTESGDIRAEMWIQYESGDYSNACKSFESALKNDPDNLELSFYLGISALETNQAGSAVKNFDSIVKNVNSRFYEPAQWYLALAYLKMEDVDAAKEVFKTIADGSGSYSDRAAEVYELIR